MDKIKYFLWAFALLIFSLTGCAHKNTNTYYTASTSVAFQNQKTDASPPSQNSDRKSSDQNISEEFMDDDLDFLDEEEDMEIVRVADPLILWNRAMFHFNDKFYLWVLEPVAKGYRTVAPEPVRSGVKNFFYNLKAPIRLVNCMLQGKMNKAGSEFTRFMVNSTIGVLGFGDPAENMLEIEAPSGEDLGQTLAFYGIGDGFYIIWPLMGPSSLRDSVGMFGDRYLNPVVYVEPSEAGLGARAVETVNGYSFRIGDWESLKGAGISPYEAVRDSYIQFRKKKIEE
ncbi:MAG: VacJ family lipoprotein [Desulfobacteraceae bacterium]|nr:VacJ family lipoprotein [Desulfobacteraceae bacterium]